MKISGRIPFSGRRQNFSRADPGLIFAHSIWRIRDTLSIVRPMDSSSVVAMMRKDLTDLARTICVWPPETRRVRYGNRG